jgi:hypothetical protein
MFVNNGHLAGIVPVASQPYDFSFPWHDCLQPIGKNYLAIERSILECAFAGCDTIWVVVNDDMQPLIKSRLGDYAQDPVYIFRKYDPGHIKEHNKLIPIYYVPIHPNDRGKRDCLAWSALHGANTSYRVSAGMSKWLTPSRYYVSFPYAIYDPSIVREYRQQIMSKQTFYLEYEGKTVKDGMYLGFTFNEEEYKNYRDHLRETSTGAYKPVPTGKYPSEKLPLEERYSARFFSLDKVFGIGDTSGANVVETPHYFNIDSWEGLRTYLGSDHRIYRHNTLLTGKKFNRIGEDIEEE